MEPQTTTDSPSYTKRRDSQSHLQPAVQVPSTTPSPSPSRSPSPSLHTPPQHQSAPLSTSEPFLRFPRPLGNRHLANWVSSSDPDIMRLTTTTTPDEGGLSESGYELISGGTDSEYDDGNNESMTGSVASVASIASDFQRPDDVHSLAGTEQTYDDESSADPEENISRVVEAAEYDGAQSNITVIDAPASDDSDSEEEHSRSSLEYTQESLKIPSIPTPDASKIIDMKPNDPIETKPQEQTSKASLLSQAKHGASLVWARLKEDDIDILNFSRERLSLYVQILVSLGLAAYGMSLVTNNAAIVPVVPEIATTTTVNPLCSKSTSLSPRGNSGMDLIAREDTSDDWIFGSKKPVVSFTPQARGDVLVHVPDDVKKTWLAKECMTMKADRNGEHVEAVLKQVDEGILVRFASKEAHGVVDLALKTTCRPKVDKSVTVHFNKGIMEEAFEITKHFADFVPAAAQEAERRFEGAKRSLNTASDTFGHKFLSMSDSFLKSLGQTLAKGHRSLNNGYYNGTLGRFKKSTEEAANKFKTFAQHFSEQAAEQAAEQLPYVQDLQDQLQLGVLNAQVSAKTWWLKATGQEGHAVYQQKAKDFVNQKRIAAEAASRARHAEKTAELSGAWSRMLRKGRRCESTATRGRRGTHQCIQVA